MVVASSIWLLILLHVFCLCAFVNTAWYLRNMLSASTCAALPTMSCLSVSLLAPSRSCTSASTMGQLKVFQQQWALLVKRPSWIRRFCMPGSRIRGLAIP